MLIDELITRMGRSERLDPTIETLSDAAHRVIGRGPLKDLLSGTWLGHPVHPALTDIPIGAFTTATVLDMFAGTGTRRAANGFVGLGLLSAVPTAAAGWADWSDAGGEERRIGVVHAAGNVAGLLLYAASVPPRRRGDRVRATLLGLGGMTFMTVAGILGGHLVFVRGTGVNRAAFDAPDDGWRAVAPATKLDGGEPVVSEDDGPAVLVCRVGGTVHAVGDVCTHAGGPLHEGELRDGTVTCPWHGSTFDVDDGRAVHGPASVPVAAYDVRHDDETVSVRRR